MVNVLAFVRFCQRIRILRQMESDSLGIVRLRVRNNFMSAWEYYMKCMQSSIDLTRVPRYDIQIFRLRLQLHPESPLP